jgi:hypothetical protein
MESMVRREVSQLTFEGVNRPISNDDYLFSDFNFDNPRKQTDERIRNREHIFKLICWGLVTIFTTILLLLFIYNIIVGNYQFVFTDLRFSDLLSLIMAIFAIVLSILFYLKATETSNTFYDNTYQFTSHISEILGRIEASFTERLRHIDEGQVDLKQKMEKLPSYANPEITKKEMSDESKRLDTELKSKETMIKQLLEKTQLEAHEKERVLTDLKEKEKTINEMRNEISHLSRKMDTERKTTRLGQRPPLLSVMRDYLLKTLLKDSTLSKDEFYALGFADILRNFENNIQNYNPEFIQDMKNVFFLDNQNQLTPRGIEFLSNTVKFGKQKRPDGS